MTTAWENQLYFGDNLAILRKHTPDASVDLVDLSRAVRRASALWTHRAKIRPQKIRTRGLCPSLGSVRHVHEKNRGKRAHSARYAECPNVIWSDLEDTALAELQRQRQLRTLMVAKERVRNNITNRDGL
jgi:hypothetical protein